MSYGCFESAWLLSHLNLDECLEVFSTKDFNVQLLHECVIIGTRLIAQDSQEAGEINIFLFIIFKTLYFVRYFC